MKKVLITGAFGQLGSELIFKLREMLGEDNVIAAGHKIVPPKRIMKAGPIDYIDVTDKKAFFQKVKKYEVDTIFHLAGILSANGEKNPEIAWNVNVLGVYNCLEIGRELSLEKIIIPSSIAAFGPNTPRDNTPNDTIQRPSTMYGLSKVTRELLGNYYFHKYNLDVRGLRFPGVISSETLPGGGTTDYAVEIFYKAIKNQKYTCFLKQDTYLPMMYMPDALKAFIDLAKAPVSKLKHHADFNIHSMSFCPSELADEIKKHIPEFTMDYAPDFRQKIADSWPKSLDDSAARKEWGWKPKYDIKTMTKDMIAKLAPRLM